jgi:hypothetical protein
MRKITISLVFIISSLYSHSQDTLYFNSSWAKCEKQNADYYRVIKPKDGIYEIQDFYRSNILQMRGYSSFKDSLFKQGEFNYYNEKGMLTEVVLFIDNVKNGKSSQYFDNGKTKRITNFVNGNFNGETIYFNLNGIIIGKGQAKDNYWFGKWEKFNDDGSFMTYLFYDDKFEFNEIGIKTFTPNNIWVYFDKIETDTSVRYFCRPVNSKNNAIAKFTEAPDVTVIIPKGKSNDFKILSEGSFDYKFNVKDTGIKIENVELVKHIPIKNSFFFYYYIDLISKLKKFEIIIAVNEDKFEFYEEIINEFISNLYLDKR